MTGIQTADNNISWYMNMVNNIPHLSKEKQKELAVAYHTKGDINAARKLAESNLKFVVWYAKKYTGYGLPIVDLIQEGNYGLLKAIKLYDPSTDISLPSFAKFHIKHYIINFILNNIRMFKLGTTKQEKKLFFLLNTSKSSMTQEEVDDIAQKHNIPHEKIRKSFAKFKSSSISSTFNNNTDDVDDILSEIDDGHDLLDDIMNAEEQTVLMAKLQKELDTMNERWRDIIFSRYNDQPQTYAELSKKYGVSLQRIAQIEKKALGHLKNTIA